MTAPQKITLGEHIRQIHRYEPIVADVEYRLLGMRSKIGGPFVRETKLGAEISTQKLNRVQKGDFIYSRLFAWQGSFGLVPEEMHGCYVSNEFPLFELDTTRISPRYLVYWFGLSHVQKQVEADCSGSTPKTRNRYKEEYFSALKLLLPSIEEQCRIVTKLEALSATIDNVKLLQQEIQTAAQVMLHSVFNKLIEGAKYLPMAEVAPIIRRKVEVEMDSEYPELGVRSFGKGTFHKPVLHGIDVGTKKLYSMEPGDMVFSNVFSWEGAIAVIKPEDEGRVGSHRFITCVPKPEVATAEFLRFYLLTDEGIEKIREASPGGAGRNRTLGLKKLEKIKVPVPNYNKQLWFDNLQAKTTAIKKAHSANLTELDALLPAILDKAFRGKL